jgi:alpha(1,3/1,4) fucosyltransferase
MVNKKTPLVSIFPPSKKQLNNKILIDSSSKLGSLNPLHYLYTEMNRKYQVVTLDSITTFSKSDVVIFHKIPFLTIVISLLLKFKSRTIYIASEPPAVIWYNEKKYLKLIKKFIDVIFTWDDDLYGVSGFEKLYLPSIIERKKPTTSYDNRNLVTQISSHKYSYHNSENYSLRRMFNKNTQNLFNKDEFRFYGYGWNSDQFPSYSGEIDDKYLVLQNYKFALCFENSHGFNGYITEKIFDCFNCGTIPIYYGAKNISDYVPKECYIDYRDFNSHESLANYIRSINSERWTKFNKDIDLLYSTGKLDNFNVKNYSERIINETKRQLAFIKSPKNKSIYNSLIMFFLNTNYRIFKKLKRVVDYGR